MLFHILIFPESFANGWDSPFRYLASIVRIFGQKKAFSTQGKGQNISWGLLRLAADGVKGEQTSYEHHRTNNYESQSTQNEYCHQTLYQSSEEFPGHSIFCRLSERMTI
jgi:hypothetical protein